MKIGIVGAGAIGMLFGGYMHLANHNLFFITRTKDQAEQLQEKGCQVRLHQGELLHFRPQAVGVTEVGISSALTELDLLIVTVKQPQLVSVLQWIKEYISPYVPLLFLMNGLGHQEKIWQSVENPVYYGITQSGATRLNALQVEEKGRGLTKIGKINYSQAMASLHKHVPNQRSLKRMEELISTLAEQKIPVSYTEEIEIEMWKKCVLNACINPLTAIFRVRNGQLVEDKHLHYLLFQLYAELADLIQVIYEKDAPKILNNGRLWEEIKEVCRITSENTSSMLQDLLSKRETEIEALTGFFIIEAEKHHLSLPSHQFVYHTLQFQVR